MLHYTIGFIRRGDEILLLNREKSSWMGSWNGVGGKLDKGESPEACILRETYEETGIVLEEIQFKGLVTWNVDNSYTGGMYAFVGEVPESYPYPTPIKTAEGILDWKKVDWIFHPENTGVANLSYFLSEMLQNENVYEHHFTYQNSDVINFERKKLSLLEGVN
ncbi:8-oxo-dGTP diphosphatase [Ornithinibacillus sp. BX22]|uniref:8-oxo-dGTP diphosphatase n=2 Tax=Ornithinibacillus TaxID=484508 RepID=A0A923L4Z9_9BACI|nr:MULTISPECIES: 8-oxo-dGTP diphosphatase [Ornithinibacillus]MBC5636490.1 8-oxo-dGTP diphosphatase [Ornithinibacillus hominis]MBS3680668.1 8-oxo-dGTP diphosphatase [Ornithinibacillus massiliensis]